MRNRPHEYDFRKIESQNDLKLQIFQIELQEEENHCGQFFYVS